MRDYYIFKSGTIFRKDNSVMFEYLEDNVEKRLPLPINDIDSIFIFGEMTLNTKLINFFSQNNIMLHFFNYYGYYTGTFYPKEFLSAGEVVVRQSEHYLKYKHRLQIAREFVKGAAYGIIQNLKRYRENTSDQLNKIEEFNELIDDQDTISALMGIEGNIREVYYSAFKHIIRSKIEFEKRVKNPPDNMMNALISFVNALIYSAVLKNIYKTQLNPTVSYLHEPWYRRFSLSLDVAEIFKPIFGDRIIFDLLNNNELQQHHFDKDLNFAYLKEDGRKIVVKAFDEKMKTTVRHKQLNRDVSYNKFILLELYKLIKHILGEQEYKSLRIWW